MILTLTVERSNYEHRADALELAERLVKRYGSLRQAGYAYADRYGLSPETGVRLLTRLRHGPQQYVTDNTLDRLSVML